MSDSMKSPPPHTHTHTHTRSGISSLHCLPLHASQFTPRYGGSPETTLVNIRKEFKYCKPIAPPQESQWMKPLHAYGTGLIRSVASHPSTSLSHPYVSFLTFQVLEAQLTAVQSVCMAGILTSCWAAVSVYAVRRHLLPSLPCGYSFNSC